nr:portal protein [Sphingomonas asaccharolytica]
MKASRMPFEAEWKDIAKYAAPSRSRFLNGDSKRIRSPKMLDEHGIYAFRTLTGGMTSGLSSPSRPWFTLATSEDLMEDYEVKAYLSDVEREMYAFLARTNFYAAAKTGYTELGLFGTEACFMEEHAERGAVCHALTAGTYWVATSNALTVDTLYRRSPMTVKQAVDKFGNAVSPTVRAAYDSSKYDQMVPVFHALEPRTEYDDSKMDSRNMPWRSVYWEEGSDHDAVLRESGYREQPFWAPRWDTIDNDPWGYSPGMDALPSLRELQAQNRRRNEAIDQLVKPEKVVDAKVQLTGMPGSIVSVPAITERMAMVPYPMPYQAVAAIETQIQNSRGQVDRAAYADLFMAITNMQGIQPRTVEEIASRNEEKLTQLGPVIERVNTEKLEVGIDRTFGIMQRNGLLPPAPDKLHGVNLRIDFVSILTQMQRMVGLGQIERTVAFVGNLAARFPEAADNLDIDETVNEYADRAGMPKKLIRSGDAVKAIRAQRAQQQQAQQMAAAAPAMQQGADAARLLSEADAHGTSLLDRVMPA